MKKYMGRFAAIAFAVFMIAPLAMAGYQSPNYRQAEPSTSYDIGNVFDETDAVKKGADHLYLNGYVTQLWSISAQPSLTAEDSMTSTLFGHAAYMGFWRDCNGDGFIGSAVTGTEAYPAALGFDATLCPTGSGYVNADGNGWVTEFLWIGPTDEYPTKTTNEDQHGRQELVDDDDKKVWFNLTGPISIEDTGHRHIVDDAARVWGDFGLPDDMPATTGALIPLPKGSLSGGWERNIKLVDDLTFNQLSGQVDPVLAPTGVSYSDLVAVGAELDKAGVPSPLAVAKNLHNSSHEPTGGQPNCGGAGQDPCTGAYAQPFIVIWDCDDDAVGKDKGYYVDIPTNPVTGDGGREYLFAPISVGQPNADGTVSGTYYQFQRGLNYGAQDSQEGDEQGDQVRCDNTQDPMPSYDNLERTSAVGVDTPKKTETNFEFGFSPPDRFYEASSSDSRRSSGEYDLVNGDGRMLPVPNTGLIDGAPYLEEPLNWYTGGWYEFGGWLQSPSISNPQGNFREFAFASTATYYGFVSDNATNAAPSGNAVLPSFSGQYGQEHCFDANGPAFGPGIEGDGTWDCDPNSGKDDDSVEGWYDSFHERKFWNVAVGQAFVVRDVDCYDRTFAGFTTPQAFRAALGGYDCDNHPRL